MVIQENGYIFFLIQFRGADDVFKDFAAFYAIIMIGYIFFYVFF